MEHRNAAADRRLKQEIAAVCLCKLQQLQPVLGHHLLVGRHNALSLFQRASAVVQRRAAPADRLNQDGDLRIVFNHGEIPHHHIRKRVVRIIMPDQNIFQTDFLSGVLGNQRRVSSQKLRRAAADNAIARYCNIEHGAPQ